MTTIGTKIYTLLKGEVVGEDQFGNKYYKLKGTSTTDRKSKRWVVYKGVAEPSKVPPEWHSWLHYTTNSIPQGKYKWQKEHTPNLTGTKYAYFPPGHAKSGGQRDKATGDYEAWKPDAK